MVPNNNDGAFFQELLRSMNPSPKIKIKDREYHTPFEKPI
jgi:hypothetical protein